MFVAEADGTRVNDRVEYEPPLGWIGKLIDPIMVRPSLAFLFNYRKKKTRELLERNVVSREVSGRPSSVA